MINCDKCKDLKIIPIITEKTNRPNSKHFRSTVILANNPTIDFYDCECSYDHPVDKITLDKLIEDYTYYLP